MHDRSLTRYNRQTRHSPLMTVQLAGCYRSIEGIEGRNRFDVVNPNGSGRDRRDSYSTASLLAQTSTFVVVDQDWNKLQPRSTSRGRVCSTRSASHCAMLMEKAGRNVLTTRSSHTCMLCRSPIHLHRMQRSTLEPALRRH
jgi:hypothetical protein